MNKIVRASAAICISGLAAYAALTVIRVIVGLPAPYVHNYGENIVLVNAWGLATGHGLYRLSELNNVPVFMAPYPPVIYLLVALGIKVWGITFIPGRLLGFLAWIGCAVMIAGIARRRGCDKTSSIIAALAFSATWPVYVWARYLRVDALAIFLETAAVFILLGRNAPKRRAIAFIALAVMAGYTKQSAFGLVVGTLLGLMLDGDARQRKRIFLIGVFYGLAAFLIFVALELITKGTFHIFALGSFRKIIEWRILLGRLTALSQDPLCIAVIVLGIAAMLKRRGGWWTVTFIAVPMVTALSTAGKMGAGLNYFIETIAACSVGMALLMSPSGERSDTRRNYATVSLCAILCLCVLGSAYSRRASLEDLWINIKRFNNAIQPGPSIMFMKMNLPPGSMVLSQYSELPLFADCVPAMSDPYSLSRMADDGKWDPSPVVEALRNHRINLVIMAEKVDSSRQMVFLPAEVAKAIEENYAPLPGYIPGRYLYAPKRLVQTPSPPQVPFGPENDEQ